MENRFDRLYELKADMKEKRERLQKIKEDMKLKKSESNSKHRGNIPNSKLKSMELTNNFEKVIRSKRNFSRTALPSIPRLKVKLQNHRL